MNYSELEEYFKDLCVKHKAVAHNEISNFAYASLMSDADLTSLSKSPGRNMVIFEDITAAPAGTPDEPLYFQEAKLSFLTKVNPTASTFISAKEALTTSLKIMFDFISRMRVDHNINDCAALRGLHQRMFWRVIPDNSIVNSIGWELTLKFTIDEPAYDAANWIA